MSSKYYGVIGYALDSYEVSPGVFDSMIVERKSRGDVLRSNLKSVTRSEILPTFSVSNQISIISDSFSEDNFGAMRYLLWKGVRWTIINVEHRHPRLILRLGDIYAGEHA